MMKSHSLILYLFFSCNENKEDKSLETVPEKVKASCPNGYSNEEFNLTVCDASNWKIYEQGPYIVISDGNNKSSIYKESVSDKSIGKIVDEAIKNDLKEWNSLEVIDKKKLMLDGREGILVQTYVPFINGSQSEMTSTTVYFKYKKYMYAINNNCYSKECITNREVIEEIISEIRLH